MAVSAAIALILNEHTEQLCDSSRKVLLQETGLSGSVQYFMRPVIFGADGSPSFVHRVQISSDDMRQLLGRDPDEVAVGIQVMHMITEGEELSSLSWPGAAQRDNLVSSHRERYAA